MKTLLAAIFTLLMITTPVAAYDATVTFDVPVELQNPENYVFYLVATSRGVSQEILLPLVPKVGINSAVAVGITAYDAPNFSLKYGLSTTPVGALDMSNILSITSDNLANLIDAAASAKVDPKFVKCGYSCGAQASASDALKFLKLAVTKTPLQCEAEGTIIIEGNSFRGETTLESLR